MLKKILLLAAVFYLAGLGLTQTTQTGNILGIVSSADGPLAGVTVTIKSPAMILPSMTMTTGAKGAYRFMSLAPGLYEMTFEAPGMQTVIRKGVRVLVAQNTTIDIVMEQKTLQESVTVIGQSPTIDKQRTTRAVIQDRIFMQSIPAARVDSSVYFEMVPGVTSASAHGGARTDNSYNLDGVNVNDPGTNLLGALFGLDIMEEYSVQTGGLAAEYGSVRGAMMNIVTRSGGNKFSGMASFYFNHERLKSDNTKGTPLAGSKSGNRQEIEPVLTLGGPVIKDKLWFFVNASYDLQEAFVPGYPAGVPPGQERLLKGFTYFPFGKLSFQPGPDDKLSLSYNFSTYRTYDAGANKFATESVTQKYNTPLHVASLQWTKYLGSNFFANLRFGGYIRTINLDAKGNAAQEVDANTGISSGNAWRNKDYYTRKRYQVNADATAFIDNLAGTHELKFGGEAELAPTAWKVYGVADPVTGGCYNYNYGSRRYYTWVLINNGFDRKDKMINFAGFVQDNWALSRNLSLNLGLRLEYISVVLPPQNTSEGPIQFFGQTYNRSILKTMVLYKWIDWAPRVGLIYDLFRNGKTVFKVSWSRYTIPNFVNPAAAAANPNSWFFYSQYLNPDGSAIPGAISPIAYPGGAQNPGGARIGYKNYPLKAAYTDELTIGAERELLPDFSASVRYIRKWDRDWPMPVDAFQLDIDKLMSTGQLDWSRNWTTKTSIDPYNGQTVTFYEKINLSGLELYVVNPPGANRDYRGIEFTLEKRFSRGWSFNFSYVYAKSTGLITTGAADMSTQALFVNPNAHIHADGVLPLERRHQFKLTGLVKGPFGINLGGYFQYLSGAPVTRLISNNFLGLSLKQNVTIFAEQIGSSHLPPFIQLDLRLEKVFRISVANLGVLADCFNVFNRGAATNAWVNSSNARTPYMQMTAINTPRIFQLGIRIEY